VNAEHKADHACRNGRTVVPSPDYQNIEVEVEGDIAVVTLASQTGRGNTSNGIGPELAEFFRLTMLDRRAFEGPYEDIRAIVLRGKGNRFCTGGDVDAMRVQAGSMVDLRSNPQWVDRLPMERFWERRVHAFKCDIPVVAAVKGHAIGMGMEIALMADIAIMSETAKIGDPHIRRGLTSPGSAFPLIWCLGLARAKLMIMKGQYLTGREAADVGLVSRAVPAEDVISEAMAEAQELASLPPLAIRWAKRSLNAILMRELTAFADMDAALEALTMLSGDHAEAVNAFLDKREHARYTRS
jgi:enoyl-CoA hydratase/carnithine racemase